MNTFASLFTGGDLAGQGAIAAGLSPIWGVEMDADIASVAIMNGLANTLVSDVCDVDYSRLETPYWLHASTVCINASVAKKDAAEAIEDIESAKAVARAIVTLRPPMFSLENVWKYRTFESFRIICKALESQGYNFRFWHLNAADYGVPQTRKRLILVASRIRKVNRPQATHRQGGDLFLPAWVGWYEAIEDLIPTLPESKFADWQLRRLADSFKGSCLVGGGNSNQDKVESVARHTLQPAFTVASCNALRNNRAFIAHPTADNDRFVVSPNDEPSFTIKTGWQKPRAFLAAVQGEASTARVGEGSSPTITTAHGNEKYRAFIVSDQKGEGAHTVRGGECRTFTTDTRRAAKTKAFIVDGKPADYSGEKLQIMEGESPDRTLTASQTRHPFRAWLEHGRVVAMTPRALARFQSIPDSYVLPVKNSLACRVIGNAVPPLLMRRIIEANL